MEDEDVITGEAELAFGAGDRLRMAREEQGLTLEQVSAKTRIPQRHIETIEAGDFANLPARTYAVGFSRTYAKVLGLDQKEIADQVREELGAEDPGERYGRQEQLQPGDPARVPSRGLVFFSIAAIVLLVAGGFMFYRTFFAPGSGPGSLLTAEQRMQANAEAEAEQTDAQSGAAAPINTAGPVVFTATMDETWVKFYESDGTRLMEKQMAAGESYTIPANAQDPQIWTGRPYAFDITIGGREIPKLSEEDTVIQDVPISAEALLARDQNVPPNSADAAPADAAPAGEVEADAAPVNEVEAVSTDPVT
ncbi:helix-turn-helix domain-containing protein [Parerythrobacter jejuensis]|uniref:DUF4115 domain-containing protein n=1 Tax=Parerythrobacter jejuensis TaxID=795812 RepID=A0A845AQ04_9SPHN|nr:helix-turn-helix domain-containing protein [Parerythrobacter jejuensis]MXP31477.1 DUF4115 domain-containing protein [Parerythrobacter jejuensis]